MLRKEKRRKEKRREGAIREAGRKPACLRPRRRGGLRFASPLRSPATQVSAVGRPGCRGRQPLHSAPVMASRKRLRRSRRILRKNDSSTPLRMTNVGCVPAVGAAIGRPPTTTRARPRAIRESPLHGHLRPRRRGRRPRRPGAANCPSHQARANPHNALASPAGGLGCGSRRSPARRLSEGGLVRLRRLKPPSAGSG